MDRAYVFGISLVDCIFALGVYPQKENKGIELIRKLKVARRYTQSLGVVGVSESVCRGSETGMAEGPDLWSRAGKRWRWSFSC